MSDTITPAGTPGPVATSGSSPGDASIAVVWTAPSSNGGSAITGYLIEYSATSPTYSESITALSTDTRLTLTGLVNGTSYYVRIKAVNAVGAGDAVDLGGGSTILVKGTAGSTVGAVTSITRTTATISATINARGNTTTPTLRWGLAGGSQTDTNLSAVTSDSVLVTSNLTGLSPGRRYQVTSDVNPGISQDVGGRPIYFTTTPDSPTGVSSTSTTSKVTVSWTYDSGASGYWFTYNAIALLSGVQVGLGCTDVSASSGGRSSCEFTGLTANTTYTFQITSKINGGDYGNGTSDAYVLTAATDPNIATISLNINGGNLNVMRGSTINIVATTNVAGTVTFRANGRIISGCKQKATSSLQATCPWRPSRHGVVSVTALFNPTSNQYTNVTTSPTSVTMTRRTSR
ncbi:MAG: fibronectin type III domain-containing protein [Actinobacteria bacterium]|nr:fibronectin type III domain-containing protein [Actinomycetota bacterium]